MRVYEIIFGFFVTIIDSKIYLLHQPAKEFLVQNNQEILPKSVHGGLKWKHSLRPQDSRRILIYKLESKDSSYGRTPLSFAAENGREAVVKLLLKDGADLESKDSYDQTPLWWAVENGHESVVKLLLERGADPGPKTKDGRTPLSYAVEKCMSL